MKTAALVVVGVLLTGWMLLQPGPEDRPPHVGTPVRTAYGSLTVTHVLLTFVPDTQGPPTRAQHRGAHGVQQLQVYVDLENRSEDPVAYAPSQFRALDSPTDRDGERSDGSTLGRGVLPAGASVGGQVWFDLEPGAPVPRWVTYSRGDGTDIAVALREVRSVAPQQHHDH